MRIDTHGQQIEVTPALRDYVETKLARLGRHFDQPSMYAPCSAWTNPTTAPRRPSTSPAARCMPTPTPSTCTPRSTCSPTSSTGCWSSTRKNSSTTIAARAPRATATSPDPARADDAAVRPAHRRPHRPAGRTARPRRRDGRRRAPAGRRRARRDHGDRRLPAPARTPGQHRDRPWRRHPARTQQCVRQRARRLPALAAPGRFRCRRRHAGRPGVRDGRARALHPAAPAVAVRTRRRFRRPRVPRRTARRTEAPTNCARRCSTDSPRPQNRRHEGRA